MDLKDIASISGKSGLYKVLKPTRTGVILEAIDAQKAKIVANANNRVSLLKEISVYTTGEESSKPLESIFESMYTKYGSSLDIDSKSSAQELLQFFETIVPDYDREKVYQSDIKKIVTWYTSLINYFPERFTSKDLESNVEPEIEKIDSTTNTEIMSSKKRAKSKTE